MVLDGATIFHVNVNCSNLDRSLRFYGDGLGLTPSSHTTPAGVQPGDAFGLAAAQWDAWIMTGDNGFAGGAIDLLEWRIPTPTGAPPVHLYEAGWQRVGLLVPDVDAARAAATAHGGTAWSDVFDTGGETALRLCFVTDPDGVAVELIHGGIGPRLAFVGITCRDISRSLAFYESLGFTKLLDVDASRETGDHLNIDGPVEMQEILVGAPGRGSVSILLAEFRTPKTIAAAPRDANELGAWRVAMLVPNLDAAIVELAALGIECLSPPAEMAMGPGLPTLRFVCFRGPDHEVLELIESPSPSGDLADK